MEQWDRFTPFHPTAATGDGPAGFSPLSPGFTPHPDCPCPSASYEVALNHGKNPWDIPMGTFMDPSSKPGPFQFPT